MIWAGLGGGLDDFAGFRGLLLVILLTSEVGFGDVADLQWLFR